MLAVDGGVGAGEGIVTRCQLCVGGASCVLGIKVMTVVNSKHPHNAARVPPTVSIPHLGK